MVKYPKAIENPNDTYHLLFFCAIKNENKDAKIKNDKRESILPVLALKINPIDEKRIIVEAKATSKLYNLFARRNKKSAVARADIAETNLVESSAFKKLKGIIEIQ